MKITMITLGSMGDVRPYMLLGQELKRRGHQVRLAAFGSFEKTVQEVGLEFFPLFGDVVKMMDSAMTPGAKGVKYLREMEGFVRQVAPELLAGLVAACDGAEALICNFFSNMYYSVAEKYNIPCIQTHFFPMDPTGDWPISSAPGLGLGKTWNHLTYFAGYLLISLLEKRYLSAWRRQLGVRQRPVHTKPDYRLNGHLIPAVYAVSPQVLPRPAEWPDNVYMTGFWWDESPVVWTPPADLEAFLAQGEPVYIGFGSMVSGDMKQTFETVLKAVELSGVRAVIARGWGGEKIEIPDLPNVYMIDAAPHDWLFPRMSAVVHHGGMGTTASGLRAGKPTLIVPFGGDQPFWGQRIHQIGCGPAPILREKMTAESLAAALKQLTGNASYRATAEKIAVAMAQEHGVATAADLIEREIAAWIAQDKEQTHV